MSCIQVQAYLGDIAGSVLDHTVKQILHKENHTFFGLPVNLKVMFMLYCYLLSVQ